MSQADDKLVVEQRDEAFTKAVGEALKGDHSDLRKEAIILRAHREASLHTVEQVEVLREALEGIFAELDNPPNAPGHGHTVPGIWDDDISNGERRGKPCEWCAHWESARAALASLHPLLVQDMGDE